MPSIAELRKQKLKRPMKQESISKPILEKKAQKNDKKHSVKTKIRDSNRNDIQKYLKDKMDFLWEMNSIIHRRRTTTKEKLDKFQEILINLQKLF